LNFANEKPARLAIPTTNTVYDVATKILFPYVLRIKPELKANRREKFSSVGNTGIPDTFKASSSAVFKDPATII
jgi:hypothetical protein